MEEMRIYGYVRCSSMDQNEDRQIIVLRKTSMPEKIFSWISSQARILTARIIKKLGQELKAEIFPISLVLTGWGVIMRKYKTSSASIPKRLESTSMYWICF